MIRVVDGCVNCGLPCIGTACPHKQELEYYCDDCGEVDRLYHFDGLELCSECVLKRLITVEGTEW